MKKGLVILGAIIFLAVLASVLYAGAYAFIEEATITTAIGAIAAISVVSIFVVKILLRK